MGYTTTIQFMNDAEDQIRNNPEQVVQNIVRAMCNTREKTMDFRVGNHSSCMTAISTAHADVPRLYFSHGNGITELGRNNDVKNLEYRKQMLKQAKEILKREQEEINRIEKEQNTTK